MTGTDLGISSVTLVQGTHQIEETQSREQSPVHYIVVSQPILVGFRG